MIISKNEYDALIEVLVEIADKMGDKNVDSALESFLEIYIQRKNPELLDSNCNHEDGCMDIAVEEGPDRIFLRDEKSKVLAELTNSRFDQEMFKSIINLSSIPNKEEVLDMLGIGNDGDSRTNPNIINFPGVKK